MMVASVLVVSAVVVKKERDILIEDMQNRGEAIAKLLSTVVMESVLTYDYVTLERYVHQIVQDKSIISIRIVRSDGETLADATREYKKGETFEVDYPVEMGGERLGNIQASFSTERVDAVLKRIIISAIIFILVIHFIALVINNLFFKKLVIQPVGLLTNAAKEFKKGNLKSRVSTPKSTSNEFNELALAFNDMAIALEGSFDDLREKQKEINTEKTKVETIVRSLADGLFVTNGDGLIASFNGAAEFISGYSRDEVIGRDCEEIFRSRFCDDACAFHNEGRIIRNKETEIITKDGRRLIVSVSSALLRDGEGRVIGGVQTFRDITAEKQRQEMLCHAEKMAAVGQMSAGIAHEINNPLGNILGFAKLLLKDGKIADDHRGKVEIIAEQADKAAEIVQGLLSFSGQREARLEMMSINSIIEKIAKLLSTQAENNGINIAIQFEDVPSIKADRGQIEQVIFNILLNAIQSIEASGIGNNIWIFSRKSNSHVEIEIRDNGPGIPENIKQRIFDPFFTTKPVGKGTGLGLSVCLGIVKEHAGTIDFASDAERGMAFVVRLPV
jgi:two-component system NtrC family sensor kinase